MNTVSRRQLLMTFGHSLAILGATAASIGFFTAAALRSNGPSDAFRFLLFHHS